MILGMFAFGAASSLTVPYSHSPVSFGSAVASLGELSLHEVCNDLHFWLFAVLLVPFVGFLLGHRKQTRVPCAIICFFLPLLPFLILETLRAVPLYLMFMLTAPMTTIRMFAGTLDGETWSNGFFVRSAMGWWSILWLVVFFMELSRANHALESTSEPARSAGPEATQG